MQQAWQLTRRTGSLVYLGFGQPGNVSYPASAFANDGHTVYSGLQGRLNMMRDLPRFIALIERGQIDLKSMGHVDVAPRSGAAGAAVLSDRTETCPVVTFAGFIPRASSATARARPWGS
jgi:S-(hydroxymethyl)glutathione dehydrogenase/alcohol dehydrogenase